MLKQKNLKLEYCIGDFGLILEEDDIKNCKTDFDFDYSKFFFIREKALIMVEESNLYFARSFKGP